MKKLGFIYAWRSLQKHWLWKNKPFAQGQAWVDLLFRASHKDHEYSHHRSKPIDQKKGEFISSILSLSKDWGWSQGKVKRFLNVLENEDMIEYKTETQKTSITIINYKDLQNNSQEERRENGEIIESKRRTDGEQTETINNDYNENNENRRRFVYQTPPPPIPPIRKAKHILVNGKLVDNPEYVPLYKENEL